ncbi:hypothetical protein AOLI_G00126090 [Acnodon oligacanthus]
MEERNAVAIARQNAHKAASRNKRNYDKKLPLEVQGRSRAKSNRKPAMINKSREQPAESEEDNEDKEEYYPITPPYQCHAESPQRQIKSHPTCGETEPKDDYPQANTC